MDSPTTPKVSLSRIRDHGWSLWDPIGLLGEKGHFSGKWSDSKNARFADEYDRYLIDAAHQIRRGVPAQKVVDFLYDIEANYMGLGERETTRERAQALVVAIKHDDLIWTWPDENGHFK
ncbi:MAG: hypothetical protein ABJM90_10635 [Paracoccaceae bacterium]